VHEGTYGDAGSSDEDTGHTASGRARPPSVAALASQGPPRGGPTVRAATGIPTVAATKPATASAVPATPAATVANAAGPVLAGARQPPSVRSERTVPAVGAPAAGRLAPLVNRPALASLGVASAGPAVAAAGPAAAARIPAPYERPSRVPSGAPDAAGSAAGPAPVTAPAAGPRRLSVPSVQSQSSADATVPAAAASQQPHRLPSVTSAGALPAAAAAGTAGAPERISMAFYTRRNKGGVPMASSAARSVRLGAESPDGMGPVLTAIATTFGRGAHGRIRRSGHPVCGRGLRIDGSS